MASSVRPLRCSTMVQARRSATGSSGADSMCRRNGLIDSGGQGGEIPQFLALRANRKIQSDMAFVNVIGARCILNRLHEVMLYDGKC